MITQNRRNRAKPVDRHQLAEFINQYGDLHGEVVVAQEALNHYKVFRRDGVILGCVKVQPLNWYLAEVCHLVVHPEYRNQGLGRFLLTEACHRAAMFDCHLVQTTVAQNNAPSEQLLRTLGFNPGLSFVGLSRRTLFVWSKVV